MMLGDEEGKKAVGKKITPRLLVQSGGYEVDAGTLQLLVYETGQSKLTTEG